MISTRSLMLVLLTVASASVAAAQSKGPTNGTAKTAVPRIECASATAAPELNHCAGIRLKKADSELAAAVEKARAQIAKRANGEKAGTWRLDLDAAQAAWITWREADCKGLVPHEWDGGTGTTLAVLECMAQMTEQRAYDLGERYAERN